MNVEDGEAEKNVKKSIETSRGSKNNISFSFESVEKKRPHSAGFPCTNSVKNREVFFRPHSAEPWKGAPRQTSARAKENFGCLCSSVSYYTYSSSKLLQGLLEAPFYNLTATAFHISSKEYLTDESKHLFRPDKSRKAKPNQIPLFQHYETNPGNKEVEEKHSVELKKLNSEKVVDKTVRFVDSCNILKLNSERKFLDKTEVNKNDDQNLPFYSSKKLKNNFFHFRKKESYCDNDLTEKTCCCEIEENLLQRKKKFLKLAPVENNKFLKKGIQSSKSKELKSTRTIKSERKSGFSQASNPLWKRPGSQEETNSYQLMLNPEDFEAQDVQSSNSGLNSHSTIEAVENLPSVREAFKKEANESAQENLLCKDPTFDEIVDLLQTLEGEDIESLNSSIKKDIREENFPSLRTTENVDGLKEVYEYLEEVEKDDESTEINVAESELCLKTFSGTFQSPRLEKLLQKDPLELAHEVLSLKLQIEDQKKGIKLLRESLAEIKEKTKETELEHQEALSKVNAEAETLVQRHQKFIKQLLNEKKDLNETISKLVGDLRVGEERHKKNMKAIEEKHKIELKKAKEAQAIAEKIKREKWMEIKTQKIKEMTVKGLEPELTRMAIRQQEEMTELRNLHREELEAVELRAARRSAELMDQLRTEMTREKEAAIARETLALRNSMEKDFENEKAKMRSQVLVLKDRIEREERKLAIREIEHQERIAECKKDSEKELQRLHNDHQEKLEEVRRKQSLEIKALRESWEGEKSIWENNFKKQQAVLLFEKETELHEQYKRERDKEIERIIEALEEESTKARSELTAAAENKLKRLEEKFDSEIKELEASEGVAKSKLSEAKSRLVEKEDIIEGLNSRLRQCRSEMTFFQKSCEEMTSERANLREIVRKEFEEQLEEASQEKKNLEKEMFLLKEKHSKELSEKEQIHFEAKKEMQRELVRVHTRVKTAVNKKEKVIESLKEEMKAMNKKCEDLEFLLDRQRKNLLL